MRKELIDRKTLEFSNTVHDYINGNREFSYDQIVRDIEIFIESNKDSNYEYAQTKCSSFFDLLKINLDSENTKIRFAQAIKRTKYSIKVAEILMKEETLSHADLAKSLGITVNNLTNQAQGLEDLNVIYIDRIGRNKYYTLTEFGEKLYAYFIQGTSQKKNSRLEEILRSKVQSKNKSQDETTF